MEELLPYYERELAFVRGTSREFAKRYPKIAAGLGLTGEACEDPHVERMIESFALLTARVSKKLDDDYPEFTESLLEVLYPHYMRPFPSSSIVQFDLGSRIGELKETTLIPRGTYVTSKPVRKVPCKFRTVYDVTLSPIMVASAQYFSSPMLPQGVSFPPETTGRLSIKFELPDKALTFNDIDLSKLRCYLHGEASLVAMLRDTLFMKVNHAFVEYPERKWQRLEKVPLASCGFEENEALIDLPASSHPAYRLLAEYFAFSEKFNFFDIPWKELYELIGRANSFTLHLLTHGISADSNEARLMETTSKDNIRLGCTPIVNLFEYQGEPIRVTQMMTEYPALADGRYSNGFDVYSIDKVFEVQEQAEATHVAEVRPFFSLRHGEGEDRKGGYWTATRDAAMSERSPGYETVISIVDSDYNPMVPRVDTLSIKMTCTNRDLPTFLSIGQREGDLLMEGDVVDAVRLLRRPTPSVRFAKGRGMHWRLISHLSLNHLSLVDTGLSALKETLHLYNLSMSSAITRQIEGLIGIDHALSTLWLEGEPFATFIKGIEIRLTINPDHFVGTSLHTFISVLDRFFGLYVHINSFTRLVILSDDGTELMRCQPCSGGLNLV
ncbi:MAG: type VI secretion system baseplate subunit TssF [Burkholderiales bacterium]|nr:type VI secretion system baseplate subunit TssF [Burkholderiales bacterium]